MQVHLRGRGRVRVAAYGLADAEHLVEKELKRLWPDARVEVPEVCRSAQGARIVEEFEVAYQLRVAIEVEASSRETAPAEALRLARGRLRGSRYDRAELEVTIHP